MAGYLPGSYALARSRAAAEAYMDLNSGLNAILNPQAQYMQAAQKHQARLTMSQVPDMPYEAPEMKRRGPGII